MCLINMLKRTLILYTTKKFLHSQRLTSKCMKFSSKEKKLLHLNVVFYYTAAS